MECPVGGRVETEAPEARPEARHRARGAQVGNRNALKHGLRAADAGRIDLRRTVDRRVLATVEALEEALGPRLTPQRALILSNVGRWLRDLAKLEAYEAELGTIVHRRRRDLLPIVERKWKLMESVNRAVERLGLEIVPPKPRSLDDVVDEIADAQDEPGGADEPEGPAGG